jgi:hypothetical protein
VLDGIIVAADAGGLEAEDLMQQRVCLQVHKAQGLDS